MKISWSVPNVHEEEKEAVIEVLKSGWLSMGKEVKKLENNIASYLNIKYAIGVNNGTSALDVALKCVGIKKEDDYIKKLLQMKAVQIITAGGEDEQVGEEKGHGIFTRHLLLALDGRADLDNDAFITASEIGTYIRPTVSRKTENMQTPRFGWILGEGDFIFENLSSFNTPAHNVVKHTRGVQSC